MKQLTLLVIGLLIMIGCSGQKLPADLPKLSPTVISVTQGGKPLAGAIVKLANADPSIDWGGVALTDEKGNATLKTNGMYDGVPAGAYKVCVTKIQNDVGPDPYAGAPDPKTDFEAYQGWLMKNERKIQAIQMQPRKSYWLTDVKYSDEKTTPLEITVTSGKNQHTVEVGEAVNVEYKDEKSPK